MHKVNGNKSFIDIKLVKHGSDMRKTNIQNKLNHKPQAHARVYKENKEKNDCQVKYFAVKRLILEGCRRMMTLPIELNFITRIV